MHAYICAKFCFAIDFSISIVYNLITKTFYRGFQYV